jgi:S-adenosylmethionine decarboxylase
MKHLSARLEGCRRDLLNDEKALSGILKNVAKEISMTIIENASHKFNPEGVSVFLLLKESHIAVHSWPELGLLDVEIVSCKKSSDVFRGLMLIAESVGAKRIEKNFWEYSF